MGLFGGSSGAVTVVEPTLLQAYARKAKAAFWSVSVPVAVLTAVVLVVFDHPVLAAVVGMLAGLVCGFVVALLVRIWPVLRVLWWWSIEITMASSLVLGMSVLARVTWPWLALAVLAVAVAVVAGVPRLRRFVLAWWRCLVVRHRLRLCFAQIIRSGTRNRAGSLPLILVARPTPAGQRVWLWLRPGLDLADLEGKTGALAVACWASEVRLVRASLRYAALIRVDIARRDPLAGTVLSPLAALILGRTGAGNSKSDDVDDTTVVPVSPGLPPLGLDLADVPEPAQPDPHRDPHRGGRR